MSSETSPIIRTPGLIMPVKPGLVAHFDDHNDHIAAHMQYLDQLTSTRIVELPEWYKKALKIGFQFSQEYLAYSP